MLHTSEKSDDMLNTISEHVKVSTWRHRRLASFDDGTFSLPFVLLFSKHLKLAGDTVNDMINITNQIEKRVLQFIINEEEGAKEEKAGMKNKKEPTPASRVGRMSLDEAEEILSKIIGYFFCALFVSFSYILSSVVTVAAQLLSVNCALLHFSPSHFFLLHFDFFFSFFYFSNISFLPPFASLSGLDTELPVQVPLEQAVSRARALEGDVASVLESNSLSFTDYQALLKRVSDVMSEWCNE